MHIRTKSTACLQRNPKSGHAWVGNRDFGLWWRLAQNRDKAAPTADHIPVTHDAEPRIFGSGVNTGGNEKFVGTQLGRTI